MDEGFELPVHYKGEELLFPGQLHLYGYTQKIEILVHGVSVLYERDEESNWRAIVDAEELEKNRTLNAELLEAIAEAIEEVLR